MLYAVSGSCGVSGELTDWWHSLPLMLVGMMKRRRAHTRPQKVTGRGSEFDGRTPALAVLGADREKAGFGLSGDFGTCWGVCVRGA